MKTSRRAFIKNMNWALAGIIGMLGFVSCEKGKEPLDEYGSPHADYTVKGAVVNKTTGEPIEGIQVGYGPLVMYGILATSYKSKSAVDEMRNVLTDAKGEFKLTATFFPEENLKLPVYVVDIDGEENGLFQSEQLQVDFKDAVHSGNPGNWYQGEYTVTLNVEMTEIENKTDE